MKNESNLNTECRTGRSPSGHCGSAFYCSAPYDCCGQCPEKCNSACGWLEDTVSDKAQKK